MRNKHTLFRVLLIISAIAVLITGAIYTKTNIQKQTLNEEIGTLKTEYKNIKKSDATYDEKSAKENPKYIYKGNNIELLEKQVDKLHLMYKVKSTKLDDIENLVKQYINKRFNYNGSTKNNKNTIINNVKQYITKDMVSTLSEKLSQSSVGNMGASDNFKHTVSILDIYYTEIEQPDADNNYAGQDFDNLPYNLAAFVKAIFNNSYTSYVRLDLTFQNDKWYIFGEDTVANIFSYDRN